MAIDPVAAGQPTSQLSRASLSDNFDTFLVLLTAQLQNQDPLAPMDSTQFTQQLVQFSQVEQQIRSNENLETLIAQNNAAAAALPLSYLGKGALIENDRAVLMEEGEARWTYAFGSAPALVTLEVKDSAGRVVRAEEGAAAAGAHAFTWDGDTDEGDRAAPGLYTLSITALNGSGARVASSINTIELVTGVDFTTGAPRVVTPSGIHQLASILGILDR